MTKAQARAIGSESTSSGLTYRELAAMVQAELDADAIGIHVVDALEVVERSKRLRHYERGRLREFVRASCMMCLGEDPPGRLSREGGIPCPACGGRGW